MGLEDFFRQRGGIAYAQRHRLPIGEQGPFGVRDVAVIPEFQFERLDGAHMRERIIARRHADAHQTLDGLDRIHAAPLADPVLLNDREPEKAACRRLFFECEDASL